tara:strand:- start:21 stop:1301 length:1281 start_codon:yes stop_codon:yes gene_type:complete
MAASASGPSRYNTIEITKKGKEPVELNAGCISVDYFESLYSPVVTASVVFIDAGGNVEDDKGKLTTVKEALPIEGLEDVKIKITTKTGELDFTKKDNMFKVNRAPVITKEANRQVVMLDLVNKKEKQNDDTAIFRKYKGKISDSVKKILKEELKISGDKVEIDKTENSYNFIGKGRGALNIVRDLCRRSVPVKGDAGYFFYQTKSKFKYKAIDELIKQEPFEEPYVYTGALKSDMETQTDSNDFKIMLEPTFVKDNDITKALKSGTYRSRNVFFNPYTFEHKEITYDITKDGVKETLGKAPEFAEDVQGFTKTNHHILDVGSLDHHPTVEINNDPQKWQATSVMRYNLLHTQIVKIQVPCNVELEAGDMIQIELESPSDTKETSKFDEQQSGRYIILHLCHHFDSDRSITSLTLVRDTYGRRKRKK